MSAVISSPLFRAASIFAIAVVHLGPVRLARRLEVIDLGADARLARDRQHLVDRFEQPVALAAHVRDVHAAGCATRPSPARQLVGLREERRACRSAPSQAHRALLHRRAGRAPRIRSSSSARRRPVRRGRSRARAPSRRSTNDATLVEMPRVTRRVEVLAERRPRDVELDVALRARHLPASSRR